MGEFLGRSLFIPIFFVVTGFLINPITLVYGIFDNFLLVACIIGALLVGKWIAASRTIRSVQPVNGCSTIECSMSCFCLCSQHQFFVRLTERFASRLTTGTPRYYQLGGRQFPEIAHHSEQAAQIAIAALR